MEQGNVPPNFIVKLKQQQTVLLRHRHRVDYIQRIRFIPSASILASLAFPALPHSSSAFTAFTCPNEKCLLPVSVLPRGRKKIGT